MEKENEMTLQEFNKSYGIQKKLVIYHSDELYKRETAMGAKAGVASVNCEGQHLLAFARVKLREYKIGLGEHFDEVDSSTQIGIMLACVLDLARKKALSYFKESMLDSGTVKQLLADIEILRMEDKLDCLKGSTDSKHNDVSIIAETYIERLRKLKLYDSIQILEESTELIRAGEIRIEYECLAIYRDVLDTCSHKERILWDAISSGRTCEIIDMAILEESCKPERQFFKVFGLHNEIHAVVKDVIARGIPWEQVQVVTSNTAGFYPLMTYLEGLGIPYCMPEGISEKYCYAASHIQTYLDNPANFLIDSHGSVNTGEVFSGLADRLEKVAANPKLPLPSVLTLLNKAALCRKSMACYDFEADYYVVVKLVQNILLGGKSLEDQKEEGALYVGSLSHTELAFRPYVYLIGFEARNYPGDNTQSPILLDEEMRSMGLSEQYLSGKRREESEKKLQRIVASATKLVTISYVSYDTVNMREQNPSAFYQKERGKTAGKERLFGFAEENRTDILEAREWLLQK